MEVINGPEKGKQGTVLKVLREQNRVIIEGVNVVGRFMYRNVYVPTYIPPSSCLTTATHTPLPPHTHAHTETKNTKGNLSR